MRTFNPDSRCAKCGGSRSSTNWCSQDRGKRPGCESGGEHMHRQCARCGFEWLEQPLNDQDET